MNFLKINYLTLIMLLLSCSSIRNDSHNKISSKNIWIEHKIVYSDAGFILKFRYPNDITIARMIDNCVCFGVKTKYYDENEAAENDNTRQWCICVRDPDEFSVDYLISSWKSIYKEQVTEQRDSITIDNTKAIRITFKSDTSETSYRQLIYLKKYSTLFEIMNVNEVTEKDFEVFCKSISIKKYTKTRKG